MRPFTTTLRELSPAYFALVMSTGIISVGLHDFGWLIPLLLALGVWRHVVHRVSLRYEPGLWSMVFPLGMFALAATRIGRLDAFPPAHTIGAVGLAIAVGVWMLVFVGMLVTLVTLPRRAARA